METDIGSDIPISEEGHHRKSKRLKTTVEKFDGKISLGRADQEFSLSPEELPYRTRFVAIQDMFKRNYSNKDIEAMKELIIKHEGWVRSDLLPEGWMFKQIAEGITKDNKWYATLHYISDDGITFEVMKTSLDHMESLPKYSEVEVTDCQEFLREQKPILLEGSEDASGHERSSRDATRTF